jgi:hypothetical protein
LGLAGLAVQRHPDGPVAPAERLNGKLCLAGNTGCGRRAAFFSGQYLETQKPPAVSRRGLPIAWPVRGPRQTVTRRIVGGARFMSSALGLRQSCSPADGDPSGGREDLVDAMRHRITSFHVVDVSADGSLEGRFQDTSA